MSEPRRGGTDEPPDHRVALEGGWSVWSWACLRATGFPVEHVLVLGAPAAAAAADQLADALDRAGEARARAIAALERAPASKLVTRAIKALRRGELPSAELPPAELPAAELAGEGELAVALDAVRRAEAAREAAQQRAAQALADDHRQIAAQLHAAAADPRFREAVLWQNRVAVHGSIAALLRRPFDASDSKTREQRRLVASYLQRYCVKNDTIGFFGPVGWARLGAGPEPIAVRPGPALLASRTVYFEHWGIDALAQRLSGDPALRPDAAPRRMPSVWVDGATLVHPNGKRFELPGAVARLLAAMDGERTARQLASLVVAEAAFASEAEVFEVLAELEDKHLCTWQLEIPTATFHPERHLRDALAKVASPARERATAELDQLEARRGDVARAAGDPEALDRALHELEVSFEALTGASANRKGGETYAGRTLVFEDCRRDLELDLGRALIARLGPPLGLVLDSARWYTFAIASRYEQALRRVHDELRRAHDTPAIDYLRLEDHLPALFPGPHAEHGIVSEVLAELQARWEALLDLGDASARSIVRRADELRAAVASGFHAPGPGWPSARHHAPDVMIAAPSVEAIRRAAYRFVLGELHAGFNTVMPCLQKEHPDPERLVRAREADLPEPLVEPVWSKRRNRADFFSVSRHDLDVERGETRSARARESVLTTGELVIEELADRLWVRTRDGRWRGLLIAFLERNLIAESYARFRLLRPRRHVPRIAIDDLIVQRETWTFEAAELELARGGDELARFCAARTFARRHGMPRMVFAKTDGEAKPFFVDFESPLLVEVLGRNLKRARTLVVSEMLPALDECWLPDAAGQRYASELRLIAVDPRAWSPAR